MARLIDADKINYHEHTECMGHGDFETVRTVTDKEIAEIPTVATAEVVSCRDCRHWNPETGFCNLNSHFSMNGLDWDMFNDDDFCSLGERRTDGQAEDDRAV